MYCMQHWATLPYLYFEVNNYLKVPYLRCLSELRGIVVGTFIFQLTDLP